MKTYVISDLHSHMNVLKEFLSDIEEDDTVFCLGDTIDKGPDGIEVLNLIRNDSRFTLLMGNHELMMWEYLTLKKEYESSGKWKLMFSEIKYRLQQKETHWLKWNFGNATYADYLKQSRMEQEKIYEYLSHLPVLIRTEVNDRTFILVHASPYAYHDEDVIYFKDIRNTIEKYVWEWEPYAHVNNAIVITGHRIVPYSFHKDEVFTDGKWYDIDMGLAANSSYSSLAALCLNDLSVRYYPLKEEDRFHFPESGALEE